MDSIGAQEPAKDFMVAGTATDSLLGICESLWRPDLVRRRSNGLLSLCCCCRLAGRLGTDCMNDCWPHD
jgi:hypothetical protein